MSYGKIVEGKPIVWILTDEGNVSCSPTIGRPCGGITEGENVGFAAIKYGAIRHVRQAARQGQHRGYEKGPCR